MKRRIFLGSAIGALSVPAWALSLTDAPTPLVGIGGMPYGMFEIAKTVRDGQKVTTTYEYECNLTEAPPKDADFYGAKLDRIYVNGQLHWERTLG